MSYALKEAASGFRRAPLLTGLSAFMVCLALLVLGLFALVAHILEAALSSVEVGVEVVAFLRVGTRAVVMEAAMETLRTLPGVDQVHFYSKADALDMARVVDLALYAVGEGLSGHRERRVWNLSRGGCATSGPHFSWFSR